jgi:hypothetical protein
VCLWGFCNMWVFLVICTLYFDWSFSYPDWGFSVLFLSCKANARVKLAKTGHGPHSSTLVCICVVRYLFVLFYVFFVCKCILPPGDNPITVNKYYHIIWCPFWDTKEAITSERFSWFVAIYEYIPQHTVLRNPSIRILLNMKYHISHPYKTTENVRSF